MSDSTTPTGPRPEPVLDAQQLTRAVIGVLGAVSLLLSLIGVTFDVNDQVTQTVTALVGLAVLAAGIILPRVRALKARELVTPVASPRSADGTPLVPASTLPGADLQ